MTLARLDVSREQVLSYRRSVGALNERLRPGRRSLRSAAWAGMQDSAPRAALLSIHARVERTEPDAWEDPSLVQVWGPRNSVYVVPDRDRAVFTLGRLPDDPKERRDAEDIAALLRKRVRDRRVPSGQAAESIGVNHLRMRFASVTGTVLIRWDGAREPTVWVVPKPEIDPSRARLELARRYLHVLGPATPTAFQRWVSMSKAAAVATFEALGKALVPVRTPAGDGWILAPDEAAFREPEGPQGGVRFLPSGDAYLLAADRSLLVPGADHRRTLWPSSSVSPGGLLVRGELVGTWRRAKEQLTVRAWRRLTASARSAVEVEASTLPLPGVEGPISVRWKA
jgi:hypothetical protein